MCEKSKGTWWKSSPPFGNNIFLCCGSVGSHLEQLRELRWTELAHGGWSPPPGGSLFCWLTSTQGYPWGKLETYVENARFCPCDC